MSKYTLSEPYALRSWRTFPHGVYVKGRELPFSLSGEEFALLCLADGEQDIPDSDTLNSLLERGMIRPSGEGELLRPWQRLRKVDHGLKPYLGIEITERCNYRCRHCFNAADNAVPRCELSLHEIEGLLDQAVDCGMGNVLLTGGEPLLHPDFAGIVKAIAEREMQLYELNTNGALLTADTLALLQNCGFAPTMKISFDGLGFHDTMRGVADAEKRTLEAMGLCVDAGLTVKAQMNLNRLNADTILPSLHLLSGMGVQECRIIRTTEAPRWNENQGDATLSWEEYFAVCLDVAGKAAAESLPIRLTFWEFLSLYPENRAFRSQCVRYSSRSYKPSRPLCKTVYGMPAVGADGELYPCMQMSGFMKRSAIRLGNIRQQPLSELLRHSPYARFAAQTLGDKLRKTPDCLFCPYLASCGGGCPAIAQLTSGDFLGLDKAKCVYFHNGWHEKITAALPDWTDLAPIE